MTRRLSVTALVIALGLSACAPSVSLLKLPTPQAVNVPTPPICPGALTADLLSAPPVPDKAGFPKASNPGEGEAISSYLEWIAAYAHWAKEGWRRASDAKTFCTNPIPNK